MTTTSLSAPQQQLLNLFAGLDLPDRAAALLRRAVAATTDPPARAAVGGPPGGRGLKHQQQREFCDIPLII